MVYICNMRKKTFKYRLYPSEKQARALQSSLDACRWVYNKTLEVRKQAWEEQNPSSYLFDVKAFDLFKKWIQEEIIHDKEVSE